MGFKNDDACLAKVADDEPIFVLRAKDLLAPMIVLHWAELASRLGCLDQGKWDEAIELAEKMDEWQRNHPDDAHMPT